ncbi:hypothetical protein [Paracoccus benzoatiresistens]|uniref:DUF2497 domain-containing protein n=1 Tax=Paracoccus benzoatiresistens TaxID=2997341 RepID=A0ABT4J545_9RHOB|nr:hypothetical protein [Paracoccus sp. EF6]MCZ0961508.1 hypothetical protein [Paracoccus sp. EF6]
MADPRFSQNAARLSEDIGDVLSAIRRMIADDDALSSARAGVQVERGNLIQDDAGEFLARRYGGNAALARRMVETAESVRPVEPSVVAAVQQPEPPQATPIVLRVPSETASNVAPLRVGAERRIAEPEQAKPSGWRAWLRSEPREATPPQPQQRPAPGSVASAIQDGGDDADDFAEAFDWKARMRPELDELAPVAALRPAEQRLSVWAMSPEPAAMDTVAQLSAAADAFDAELQAQAGMEDAEQDIRALLREMVQEELNGELGERFSANLRAVIRREVAAAIEAQLDRF